QSDPARTFFPPERLFFHERSSMTPSATAVLQIQEADGAAEAHWVAAARAGDPDATLRLLNRYRPPLLRLLTGLTGDLATAEDLVQEALLQAFRCLAQLRDPAAFYPWVRRLALRHALRRLRQRREVHFDAAIALNSHTDTLR